MVHPKYKRYFRQTLAFGLIWLTFGLIYALLEKGILGRLIEYPSTGVAYDFQNALIYIGVGSFFGGLVQGWIEVTWLRKRFAKNRFWVKILFKSVFYLLFLILFLILLSLITNARRLGIPIYDPIALENVSQFVGDFAFWSVIIYAGAALDVALFYSEVNAYLGNGAIYNYSLGKYHKPREEKRIFMFLDMKSSTFIAEQLGHLEYFTLLKMYYADMTNPILETLGEIYQYVGDEIVVSWSLKNGSYNNNCLECFRKIDNRFKERSAYYRKRFGVVPGFKAGYHIGKVTVGEIGIIKKDIIYTGDTLNTTARIQEGCNTYNAKTLVSNDLIKVLPKSDTFLFTKIGSLILKGKTKAIQLFRMDFNLPPSKG
ncbi:adenylate/guanylate cyclase domain-containing protein [Ulvibacterium marinum]|uniref:adenylate/guanylate cyclase domain-containing protein n=1 Tax=Ulvibacterium marinum TaxID=2419782 RepID=UPI002495553B|nr:adenylate/guanylate cyclase domain-containing protein [Ulvibacterium marinum]